MGHWASLCRDDSLEQFLFLHVLTIHDIQLRSHELPARYFHVWACTTDCGPDQIGSRNALKALLSTDPIYNDQFWFDLGCLKHQFHLIVKDSLRVTNQLLKKADHSWKYFSALAQITHTWRSHAKKITNAWELLFPEHARHDKAARVLPPVPLAGRWGSITCTLVLTGSYGRS